MKAIDNKELILALEQLEKEKGIKKEYVLGEKLNVDIYLAAIVVFVGRMFNNLGIIRRYYVEKWTNKVKKESNNEEK